MQFFEGGFDWPGEFAGVVGVQGDEERGFDVQGVGQGIGDQGGVGDGRAGVDAQNLDMRNRRELVENTG